MIELKPCPFCGSKNLLMTVEKLGFPFGLEEEQVWTIECGQCEARGPEHTSKNSAVEAWNRRPK